jgi:hypothetical protein
MTSRISRMILTIWILFYISACGNQSKVNNKYLISDQETSKLKTQESKENAFEDLRNIAFTIPPEQLGVISILPGKTFVYGIIMDWGINGATASIVAYQTGDASLYLSSGSGVIGGGQHENVNSAAKDFVSLAQTFLKKATKTEKTTLPSTDEVQFYLLTNKGVYVGVEQVKNFENNSSPWLKLFKEGNKVLAQLRSISKK